MSHDNVEVVRRLYKAFNQRDVEAASHLWAAVGEWRPAFTGGGLVEGAIFRGHEGVSEFLEQQAASWERMVAEPAGRAYTSEADALEALGA